MNKLEIVLTGVAKRVPWRLPGWILEIILDCFFRNSAAFDKAWCQEDLEGTGKKRNSHGAEKDKELTVKSREETGANREGTSKAGKGPLNHHEDNREGPGQKKRQAQRTSRAMRKHGRAVRK